MSGSFDPFAFVGSLAKQTGFSRIAKGQLLGGPIACFQRMVRRHGPAGSAPPNNRPRRSGRSVLIVGFLKSFGVRWLARFGVLRTIQPSTGISVQRAARLPDFIQERLGQA